MKLPTNDKNVAKVAAPAGCSYANIVVKFQFWGPTTHPCNDWGEIWRGGVDLWSTPPCQITPQSVQRVALAGQKPHTMLQVNKLAPYRTDGRLLLTANFKVT